MTGRRYFGTDGIRGRVGEAPISADWILKLGWAAGRVLAADGPGKVVIGKDTRISGYMFEAALEAGLAAAGLDIYLLGPMPTPAIAYLTRTLQAKAGIVISASHNPYCDNGIKFFSADGFKLSDQVELAIEAQLEMPLSTVAAEKIGRAVRVKDAAGRYIEFCKSTFPKNLNLKDLKIVVDCAHGATYHVAPNVFSELGASVVPVAVKPNGFNINQQCGSTCPELLAEQVVLENADVGIAFDGDGDRVIFVDHTGTVVDGDELLCIMALCLQRQRRLAGGVVGTKMSNLGLELALKQRGIPFYRSAVGDRHVLQALQERAWNLGGESSGHLICLDANTTGDGIVAALMVLAAMISEKKSLNVLTQAMEKLPQVLLNVPVKAEDKSQILAEPAVQQALKKAMETLGDAGRVLLRPSGTEALVRVMVEGRDPTLIHKVAKDLERVVQEAPAFSV